MAIELHLFFEFLFSIPKKSFPVEQPNILNCFFSRTMSARSRQTRPRRGRTPPGVQGVQGHRAPCSQRRRQPQERPRREQTPFSRREEREQHTPRQRGSEVPDVRWMKTILRQLAQLADMDDMLSSSFSSQRLFDFDSRSHNRSRSPDQRRSRNRSRSPHKRWADRWATYNSDRENSDEDGDFGGEEKHVEETPSTVVNRWSVLDFAMCALSPNEQSLECEICMSAVDKGKYAVLTVCGHYFCFTCLAEWEKTQKRQQIENHDQVKFTCPTCRGCLDSPNTTRRS